jgi:hypothetical protein
MAAGVSTTMHRNFLLDTVILGQLERPRRDSSRRRASSWRAAQHALFSLGINGVDFQGVLPSRLKFT